MKYRILLSVLRFLVYIKRGIWWFGKSIGQALGAIWSVIWRFVGLVTYKINYALKKAGLGRAGEWFTKRDVLQFLVFLVLFFVGWSQTKFFSEKDLVVANQKTIAYQFFASDAEFGVEEVLADTQVVTSESAAWRSAAVSIGLKAGQPIVAPERDVATVVAGGSAFSTPIIIPGATEAVRTARTGVAEYIVEPGDSLGSIANDFDVSVATILWENKVTARTIIRPGDVLKIPPTSGVMHTVKKGDTLKKIATLYQAKADDIAVFNNLKPDGTNLKIGVRIMVPNGVAVATAGRPVITQPTKTVGRIATPPSATYVPSASGFVWPSGAHMITQYFNSRHPALDIAGAWQTPSYAAKAGVVEKAQCGWNGGYGCYVVIDHGGGVKTLYAHHSQLLVTPGEEVEPGQTIALMGNSGNVRGHTGIHLHFEVIINGVRVNPLGYVRP